jgi:hypothetical protein
MISSAPIAATTDLLSLADKVRAFVATAKSAAAGGVTVSEFAELTVSLLKIAMSAADAIPVDGADRKVFVLNAVGLLFDSVADRCIPTLAWPVWLIVKPAARQLLLLVASGAIESLLPLVRKAAA